mmetsp:Transcript_84160/g.234648  ORF Transcript_84160/g.234648 Transcript_84160/m.234648 type:complete len:135 (-) Transcript_84160:103-507(-)|eukprot:CAMPEP_0117530366 /NCGR_PEP_ID=MMETSP0784-20121206/38307_1 /TAXON_ID=39447 /ORGANISM="" /LENGTH=134 /DNA_ID=CAMNT_0005326709 /DNA_START=57 /DNA_END=461 /DNA_ORIENTATION=-
MAFHIDAKKQSDGSGRDTYIVNDAVVRHGKQPLGKTHSHKPFKHLELRGHPPQPALDAEGKPRSPSVRRGGSGWMPSIHMHDMRRTQESWAHMQNSARSVESTMQPDHLWKSGDMLSARGTANVKALYATSRSR